ncbi:hypothetical protein [Streptomyces yatensis]|uniref:hypothetical protein n=1 Tax=Streptomyces yatensis TaxID=155177 RepID=UPI001FE44541|nr:hypothetical protein [Streptomyces yatensis]
MSQPTHDAGDKPPPQVTVGLVADPDAPAELAEDLAEDLPGLLSEQIDPNVMWSVQVVRDPTPAALLDSASILDVTRERKIRDSWDIAICLTDLPLYGDGRPLAVDADTADRVALVSMPALGGIFLRRRLRRSIVRLVRDLMWADTGPVVPQRTAPLKRAAADEDLIDLRIVGSAARGRLRLLLGIVRANTPWRLIPALAKALAAALATSAVVLVNATLWNVSTAIAAERLAVVSVFSTATMVAWLIVHRHLWERPDSPSPPGPGEGRAVQRLHGGDPVPGRPGRPPRALRRGLRGGIVPHRERSTGQSAEAPGGNRRLRAPGLAGELGGHRRRSARLGVRKRRSGPPRRLRQTGEAAPRAGGTQTERGRVRHRTPLLVIK